MADVNELIGGYKLRSLLQTGQQSQVFEVTEPTSGRHFAMKVLLPEFAGNAEYRRQLFHEAEVGIKMRHENVINILKVSKDENNPHFIMEFFPSGSLRTRLMSRDPRDKQFVKDNAKKIFKQVATGLAYMNASGYIHSDVKPDNVLVNALGQTKIIDFAISRKMKVGFMEKLFPGKRVYGGTHTYIPPEQIRREILDQRADIYSYGIMLYELVTGRPPFRGASLADLHRKHLLEKPLTPQSHNPDVSDAFAAFVLRMLEKDRTKRPEQFHQVMMDLKKLKVFKSDPDSHDDEN
jgi:eukaryotic-like serine/threonine-protein kinase